MSPKAIGSLIVTGVVALVLLLVVTSCWYCVSPGNVGVASIFGDIQPKPLTSGWNWKWPWVSVHEVNTQLNYYDDKAEGSSKDLQVVHTEITVQYSQNPTMAPPTYNQIGEVKKIEAAVIKPAIQESVKSVTAQFTAEQLVTHRHQVKGLVEETIKKFIETTLADKKLPDALLVANIAITDFRFSDDFNHAIEQKVKSAQEALQAENAKVKTITEAEATADSRKLAASAESYAIQTIAQAKAEALKLEGEALAKNPEVIKLRAATQWNGELPTFMGGQAPVPFMPVQPTK
jgi:regulator of protease activity HflC (stomatin/prohibitin superfamily)